MRTHCHEKRVPALLARCRHADSPVVIRHGLHTAPCARRIFERGSGAQRAAQGTGVLALELVLVTCASASLVTSACASASNQRTAEMPRRCRRQQRGSSTPAVDEGLIEVEDERHFARNDVLVHAQPAAPPATRQGVSGQSTADPRGRSGVIPEQHAFTASFVARQTS